MTYSGSEYRASLSEERRSLLSETADKYVSYSAGSPQIWVRLRPAPLYYESVFEIGQDGQSIMLRVELDPSALMRMNCRKTLSADTLPCLNFKADGVLQNSGQDESFGFILQDCIEKAMNGVSGVIVALGPEASGKRFTLFGSMSKIDQRGIVPRALESIFDYVDSHTQKMNYVVRMGMVELRRNKIRDLLTLCPFELKTIGDDGPNGMLLQQIGCAEHGLVLLFRGLAGQKIISKSSSSRSHTILYLDIYGESLLELEPRIVKARLTFGKIAAMPKRSKDIESAQPKPQAEERVIQAHGCTYVSPPTAPKVKPNPLRPPEPVGNEPPAKSGVAEDDVLIRRDLSFLEQMFIRVSELKRLNKNYAKLKRRGAELLMKLPKTAVSQSYRQNKLSHCLQDIISGNSEVRVILHIRPERQYLATTLEAMRFAERAKCVPKDVRPPPKVGVGDGRLPTRSKKASIQMETAELEAVDQGPEKLGDDYPPGHGEKGRRKSLSGSFKDNDSEWEGSDPNGRRGSKGGDVEHGRRKTIASEKSDDRDGSPRREARGRKSKHRGKKHRKRDKDNKGGPDDEKNMDTVSNAHQSYPDREHLVSIDSEGGPRTSEFSGDTTGTAKSLLSEADGNEFVFGPDYSLYANEDGEALGEVRDTEEPPTRPVAWAEFLKSADGTVLLDDLRQKHTTLRDTSLEHNGVLQKVTLLLSMLNQHQMDLDIAQQNRHLRGDEYDTEGNIVLTPEEKELFKKIQDLQVNRDEGLDRLRSLKAHLSAQKKIIDVDKVDCESQFQAFCLERYSMAFGKDDQLPHNLNEDMCPPPFQPDISIEAAKAKHYNDLRLLAKEQARQFLRFYQQRPPWTNF